MPSRARQRDFGEQRTDVEGLWFDETHIAKPQVHQSYLR